MDLHPLCWIVRHRTGRGVSCGWSKRLRKRSSEMEPLFHMIAGAPAQVGPYSHAVELDGWLFITGQLATDPDDDSRPIPDGIEAPRSEERRVGKECRSR